VRTLPGAEKRTSGTSTTGQAVNGRHSPPRRRITGGVPSSPANSRRRTGSRPTSRASLPSSRPSRHDLTSTHPTRRPEPTESESALPDDPKKALKQLADTDGQTAKSELNGKWVPQLSSKKVGLEAEGKTWDEESILEEFEGLREEFPRVKLVWSGDFSSFKEDNFWVTVVGIGYDDPEDALSWCSSHGLGPDSCYAKQLNTSGGHEGTTRLQD
jgi:hypothetical protein